MTMNGTLAARVAVVLGDGHAMTAKEIAQRLNATEEGVFASLRGMRTRREVVALKPKVHGKPYRFRLRGEA